MNATTLWKSRSEGPFPVTSNKESDEKNNKAGVAVKQIRKHIIRDVYELLFGMDEYYYWDWWCFGLEVSIR